MMATAYLFQALPEDMIIQVASCKSAKEIWDALKTRHVGADRVQKARLQTLKTEFEILKMKEEDTIDSFTARLNSIVTRASGLGSTFDQPTLVRKLLSSVPKRFVQIVATIEQFADLETTTLDETIGRLKAYEERIGLVDENPIYNQEKLMYTRRDKNYGRGRRFGKNGQGRFNSSQDKWRDGKFKQEDDDEDSSHDAYKSRSNQKKYGKDLSKIKCYNCQRFGHYASDCPESNQREEETNLVQEDEEPTLLMAIKEDCNDLLQQAHDGKQDMEKDQGEVLLDGVNIKSLKLEWLRRQIGLVTQETALACSSIADNIAYGRPNVTLDQIEEAAKIAQVHAFISSLESGYNTPVGKSGLTLTDEHKTRISIARAVLSNPTILLLDEVTSRLNLEAENAVQETLRMMTRGRSTIMIARRLNLVKEADLIAVMDGGQCVEMGTHDELISSRGLYSELLRCEEVIKLPERLPSKNNNDNDSVDDSIEVMGYNAGRKCSPSLRRLVKLSLPECLYGVLGSVGASAFGSLRPILAYVVGLIVTAYYRHGASRFDIDKWCLIIALMAIIALVATVLHHFYFGIMGEKMTERIRRMMFSGKTVTFIIPFL
ncbi:putative transcription factor interactor and regulator CCHC(Zn) family [Helianthus annuus]|nr:putative transcription factor interactor and regulator CCHC(Zn) family [Helianthus annuus]